MFWLSCPTSSGYIYCVDRTTNGNSGSNSAFYAPVSPSGVGSWIGATSYPSSVYGQSCDVSSGEIYCIGGHSNSSPTNATYYDPISSSGVGTWQTGTNYPRTIYGQSCVSSSSYIYC